MEGSGGEGSRGERRKVKGNERIKVNTRHEWLSHANIALNSLHGNHIIRHTC